MGGGEQMKNLYTYTEIKEKIDSGDSIKHTEIEKMLRHLMMRYTCLEWERDVARDVAREMAREVARKEAEKIRGIYEEIGIFPWEEGSE
jgi:hypothetical protein